MVRSRHKSRHPDLLFEREARRHSGDDVPTPVQAQFDMFDVIQRAGKDGDSIDIFRLLNHDFQGVVRPRRVGKPGGAFPAARAADP